MKIMVTGALGHIGSALIREQALVAGCDEILLVDSLATQRFPSLFDLPRGPRYVLIPRDVSEAVSAELVADCDAVVHLAAISDPGASVADPEWLYQNNLRITRDVVDACRRAATPLVFVSTTSVYTSSSSLIDETCTDLEPVSPYARCKLEEETYVVNAVEDGLQAAVFRLGTIFGVSPGMRFHTAVNKFCWQAALGEDITVWRTALHQQRPYLDLRDATRMIARTVTNSIFPGVPVNAVTCDSTVDQILKAIESNGRSVNVNLVDSALMNELSFSTSVARAQALGFEFTGSLVEGVSETLALLGHLSPR